MQRTFDVIVIGGGHAGAEAAWAAARLGADTAMVTMEIEAIGRLSCNPAIGGIGKGQMVREIDALGGLMGLAIDRAGIQFRMLNNSKGPAVRSPRAQADRTLYPRAVRELLGGCGRLGFIEGLVDDLLIRPGSDGRPQVSGVRLRDGRTLQAKAVIITTGTFMRGLMHCGDDRREGGRVGEAAASGLSGRLIDLGFELTRFKTGTPPRVARDSIDYENLETQPGDDCPRPFSFMVERITQPQVCCWVTYTTPAAHDLIRENLHRAPMYSGQINATGVRYCPSIEDKVVRFADRPRHQIFLEPEGYDDPRVYCNGLGTSLPRDVQAGVLRRIPGLQDSRVVQWGYAVEYDVVPTHQIRYSLETKAVAGLFLAGQINGTSGYEEAAGQGILAGINAVRKLQDAAPLVIGRDEGYLGVMIDDLIARPLDEPYRMFTSRAEYRLLLRADNADERLTPVGRRIGLVDDDRWSCYQHKRDQVARLQAAVECTRRDGKPLLDFLRRPEADWQGIATDLPADCRDLPVAVGELVMARAKYAGYVARMKREIARLSRMERCRIPVDFNYAALGEMRFEARERFSAVQPQTLGQASRIGGITPADVAVLWVAVEGRARRRGSVR